GAGLVAASVLVVPAALTPFAALVLLLRLPLVGDRQRQRGRAVRSVVLVAGADANVVGDVAGRADVQRRRPGAGHVGRVPGEADGGGVGEAAAQEALDADARQRGLAVGAGGRGADDLPVQREDEGLVGQRGLRGGVGQRRGQRGRAARGRRGRADRHLH